MIFPYLLKNIHGLSYVTFSDLLELLKEAFRLLNWLSFTKSRKMIQEFCHDYEKVHVCPNECMLILKEK